MKNDMLKSENALTVFVLTPKDLQRIYEISPRALGFMESVSAMNLKWGHTKGSPE